jgi:hypothetical protein
MYLYIYSYIIYIIYICIYILYICIHTYTHTRARAHLVIYSDLDVPSFFLRGATHTLGHPRMRVPIRAQAPTAGHTRCMFDTDAVFHAPMFTLKDFAKPNACHSRTHVCASAVPPRTTAAPHRTPAEHVRRGGAPHAESGAYLDHVRHLRCIP